MRLNLEQSVFEETAKDTGLMARIGKLLCLVFLIAGLAPAYAGEYPTGAENSKTLRTQAKAEELFSRGDYKRALFIYEKELAKTGDKYSQYMTGYMYLKGHGVQADAALASAWYRLAAERGAPEFVEVRDRVMKSLSPEDRIRSDTLFVGLRKELSDVALVMMLIERDRRRLDESVTGTRLRRSTSPVRIVDPTTGRQVSLEVYENRTRRSIKARLDYLTALLDIEPLESDISDRQFAELRNQVDDFLSQVETNGDAFVDTR